MAQTKRVRLSRRARIVYRWLALLFAGLAIIGMLLPLMPGTVFAILWRHGLPAAAHSH